MTDPHRISTKAELREVISEPNPMLEQKIFDHIDRYAREFIERAPMILLATVGSDGNLDVSPKGDAPGFVAVENPKTLLIPDRPGNKLADGFCNMLDNPKVGIIFVIPGVSETLRVNGSVELTRDPEILQRLSARNKPAVLATRVMVEESFFHCGKAFIRSKLWKAETWPEGVKANIGKQIAARGNAGDELAAAIDEGLRKDYETGLY
ncbi:MAG: pyridoxamine 5'-phosphate oxidase family protein [Deltaproteobacteria bacterium]|nr:pyridoxamine 5'-phosphate oxidase family protein [Deltaproteobacteria bacterium]